MSTGSREIVLPDWQADAEVSSCPICRRPFHFLFRKHHCRRCGRIICDTCSPHRITLPRQYIVRPPGEALRYRLDSDGEDGNSDNPALGGGETVRVCNPCVPDPNYGPPPQQGPTIPPIESRAQLEQPDRFDRTIAAARARGDIVTEYDNNRVQDQAPPPESLSRPYPSRYRSSISSTTPTLREEGASTSYSRRSSSISQTFILPEVARGAARARTSRNNSSSDRSQPLPPRPSGSRPIPGLEEATSSVPQPHHGSLPPATAVPSSFSRGFFGGPQNLPPPRDSSLRQISRLTPRNRSEMEALREEDECPVCGTRHPPFGPNGDTTERERHIEDCISNHLAFNSASRQHRASDVAAVLRASSLPRPQPAGLPSPSPSQAPHPGTLVLTPGSVPAASASSAQDRAAPGAQLPARPKPPTQRMLVYHATEKDAHNEDGETQECVICFEEFEPGDEMGRLECLCKFHRRCIRQWWEEHWGSCPTHQLHD